MCSSDLKNFLRQILAYLSRHIISLSGVDDRILVGIFLLSLLIVKLNKGQNFVVCGVGLANERSGISICDICLSPAYWLTANRSTAELPRNMCRIIASFQSVVKLPANNFQGFFQNLRFRVRFLIIRRFPLFNLLHQVLPPRLFFRLA